MWVYFPWVGSARMLPAVGPSKWSLYGGSSSNYLTLRNSFMGSLLALANAQYLPITTTQDEHSPLG